MRRRAGTGRAALLAGGAALAVVGLVVLLVQAIALVTGTLRTGLTDEGSCVAAATAGEDGAEIATSLLPPRSVCTWTVGGSPQETVLAEGSAPAMTAAVVAAAAGVTLVLGTAGVALVRRRRGAPPA